MATEAAQLAVAAAPAAPGIGAALAGLGTAVKAFVVANPVGLAAVGGVLVGAGAYYALTRNRNKPAPAAAEAPAAA